MESLSAYIPMDRRHALGSGADLPDRTHGAVLFADISGFTPLTAALVEELGPQRGAEELIRQLNQVYGALIAELHRYRGSVIGFSGDAITCWLDGDDGLLSTACALDMQRTMAQFAEIQTPAGTTVSLGVKVAVIAGPARRFLVGDPEIQRLEALGGTTLDRMAAAEKQATSGEVIVGVEVAERLGERAAIQEWRTSSGGDQLALVTALTEPIAPSPWPAPPEMADETARAWIYPPVYQRLHEGQSAFLAELRPAVALFIKFWGLDYDADDDAGTKLDTYVTWVQQVVTRYEGYLVDITVGDKGSYLYAAFGAPLAHEDDPARAVTAALDLRSPPPELAFIEGVQMGISRGRMRAGALGGSARRTYAVMGNEVNVAARLMGKAEPGQIKVSPRVAHAAAGQVDFQDLGAIALKGLPEPMPVFAAVGRKAQAVEGTLKGRELAPIVGRATERAQLAGRLRALQKESTGSVVVIEGEAGIGKSRLALDLLEKARDVGVTTLLGAGQSIEQQTPYRAWRDVLAAYFDLGEITDSVERREHVRTAVEAAAPDHIQRLPLLNDVLNLGFAETDLTSSLSPELRQQSLFLLLADLLRAQAKERPLVLVLEDAHWLDGLSWELAVYAARSLQISGEPVLLVSVTRPPEENTPAARHTATLQGMEGAETLSLAEMAPEETVALVANRLGVALDDLPTPLTGLVRERAGGNPFFAEELAFSLRDQGLIHVETEGGQTHCALSEDFDQATAALPDDVQGLVLSRIDRLEPEQQLTLKVASVIGRTFAYRTLRYALRQHAEIDDEVLGRHLDSLAALDLTPLDTPEPEPVYVFRHITTQEVAYETLLFAQRRELHHAVAGWYEETFESEAERAPYYPLLVHHTHYAEDLDRELHYAGLAGHRAAAQYANDDAVRYLSRALELTSEEALEERYDLILAREKVNDLRGEREAQERDVDALKALAKASNDSRRQIEATLRQACFAEVTTRYDDAISAAEMAVTLTTDAQDINNEAVAHLQWGGILWLRGEYDAARAKLEKSRNLARVGHLPQVEADSLRVLGIVSFYRGDYASAETFLEQSLNTYRKTGDRIGEAKSRDTLGNIFAEQGDFDDAERQLTEALRICREIGDRRGEGLALMNLGIICVEQGDYASATTYCRRSLRIYREIGDRQGECWTLNNIGLILFYVGDYAKAESYCQQALGIFRELGDQQNEATALSNFSLLFSISGQNESAQEYGRQALLIARHVGDPSTEAEALTHLAHALSSQGKLKKAVEAYYEGLTIRRELGEENMAMETLAGLARVALAQEEPAQAQAWVEEILSHLETGTLDGTYEPARIYLTCYRVLEANQDPRAAEILATAHNLLQERAAKIEDEEMRRSFLENVPAHRELIEVWEKAGAIS
jgi:predicted ATPase/class 3 adenylate cyclase